MRPMLSRAALVLFLALLNGCDRGTQKTEIAFDQMTPAQHLEKAKSIMRVDDLSTIAQDEATEADRHLQAIPATVPESREAAALETQLIEAQHKKLALLIRQNYARDLEKSLQAKGYDIIVTQLGDELIVASDMLSSEAARVQYLASIRKNKGLCDMGFRRVSLSERSLSADNHSYPLSCRTPKS